MRKNVLAIIVALACAPAFATGIGNTYNTTNNTPTANGGQGGAGGQGGRGGDGGSVLGSGNSSNLNSNTNMQGQAQGQQQGQAAIGVGVGLGGEGGRAVSSSGSSSTASNGNQSMVGGTQAQDNRVTVTGDTYQAQERNPVNTAYAPSIAPTALCALGVSGGAQGVSFGLSFGKSYTDENCVLLEQIRATATVLGDRATAAEMMCDLPSYKAARARAGKPCGGAPALKSAAIAPAAPVFIATKSGCDYTGTDQYIIARRCK